MSGISCAYWLCKPLRRSTAHVNIIVLEARNRIGGRTHSVTLQSGTHSAVVDLGATWIEGDLLNPIKEMVEKFGLKYSNGSDLMIERTFDFDGQLITNSELTSIEKRVNSILSDAFEEQEFLEPDASVFEHVKERIEQKFQTEREIRLANYVLAGYEQYDGASTEKLSMKWFKRNPMFKGNYPLVVDGYGTLCNKLAESIPKKLSPQTTFEIKLESIVENINCTDKVTITYLNNATSQREQIVADYAVCTIPLGVLKQSEKLFTPPLSIEKRECIQRIGYGLLNKIVLQFETEFWDPLDSFIGHAAQLKNRFRMALNMRFYNNRSPPILVFITTCDFAAEIESWTDEQIIQECLNVLKMIYKRVETPTAYYITRWNADPFSMGSYSHTSVGTNMKDFETMSQPEFGGKLGFAGEATSQHYSTVHGAFMSGEREANRIYRLLKTCSNQ
jgi:monoamine oxidase